MAEPENTLASRNRNALANCLHVRDLLLEFSGADKALGTNLERAERFLERLFKCATDRHGLAHGLHSRSQCRVSADEFFESETRDLGDDVVDSRLKAGWSFASDVVLKFIEAVTDSELSCDFSDRETSCFRRKRRATRDTRIHLDHDHTAVRWINRELDIRTTSLHTNFADTCERSVAHQLVFFIGQCHGRSHCDGVTCVNTHRVEILNRANHHALILVVAHDFHLVFLPSE